MKREQIETLLHEKIKEYAHKKDGDISVGYSKKYTLYYVVFNRCGIVFYLTNKDRIMCPQCTLYCKIFIGKDMSERYFLHEVLAVLNPEDLRCTFFPYIQNEEKLNNCFDALTGIIEDYIEEINNLIFHDDIWRTVGKNYIDDISRVCKLSDGGIDKLEYHREYYNDYIVCAFSKDTAYQCFLRGEYDKAHKKYAKIIKRGKEMTYERLLYNYIDANPDKKYEAIPAECISNPITGDKPKDMIMLCILPFIFWSLIYIIIYGIISYFHNYNVLYVCKIGWYFCFIFAGFPMIFTGIASRNLQYRLLKRKDLTEYDELITPKWENKIIGIIAAASVIVSLIFLVNISLMTARLYSDHMVVDVSESLLRREYKTYEYEDIVNVYYLKGRYNDWGTYIKRGSYAIVFSDGSVIDLDGWTGVKETERKILPILQIEKDSVEKLDSELAIFD